MALNSSDKLIIAERRDIVSRYRRRRASIREIVEALPGPPYHCKNPDTNEPWSLGTVASDVKFLERESIKRSDRNTDELRAEDLEELDELRRVAWQKEELEFVLKCLEHKAKLQGTYAPTKFAPTSPDGNETWKPVTDDERAAIQNAVLARLGLGQPGPMPAGAGDPDRPTLAGPVPGDGPQRDAGGPVAKGAPPVGGAEADNQLLPPGGQIDDGGGLGPLDGFA
ncbi:MAG: hypothetical protein KGR26_15365 [Cyanobacteria bacterium REEB65]|nr:hypothetical protein [Cyanobacteria bacterium REEB65]